MKAINAFRFTLPVALALALPGCQGKAPLPGTIERSELELTMSNAPGKEVWLAFSNALAGQSNGSQVVVAAWTELDRLAVERAVQTYAPGELARRLDCLKRGTATSIGSPTSNQLARAYAIKVSRSEARKQDSALRRKLE